MTGQKTQSNKPESNVIDTFTKFQEKVKEGDLLTIKFAHIFKDGKWSNWTDRVYVYHAHESGIFYLVNPNDACDVFGMTKGGFGIPSMIILKQ